MPAACLELKDAMTANELIAALAKVTGRRIGQSTIHHWRTVGVRGVKLESLSVGGRVYFSRESVEKFLAATNGNESAS